MMEKGHTKPELNYRMQFLFPRCPSPHKLLDMDKGFYPFYVVVKVTPVKCQLNATSIHPSNFIHRT